MKNRRDFVVAAAALPAIATATTAAAGASGTLYGRYIDLIRKWKAHDIDGVMAHIHEEIVWYPFVGGPPVLGKAAMRKYLEGLAGKRQSNDWRVFFHAERGEQLFVEGADDFRTDQGVRIAVPYAGVLDYRDGLIVGWRDYADVGLVGEMKKSGSIPADVLPLVDRKGEP